MNKITQFDVLTCKQFKNEFEKSLEELGTKFGVNVVIKRGKYSSDNYTLSVEASVIAENGEVLDTAAEAFKRNATFFELKPEDLYKIFKCDGSQYKIVGMKPGNRKYPILAKSIDNNKTYKFSADTIKMLL